MAFTIVIRKSGNKTITWHSGKQKSVVTKESERVGKQFQNVK